MKLLLGEKLVEAKAQSKGNTEHLRGGPLAETQGVKGAAADEPENVKSPAKLWMTLNVRV